MGPRGERPREPVISRAPVLTPDANIYARRPVTAGTSWRGTNMGILRSILARAIRFGEDGLQGPEREEEIRLLKSRLGLSKWSASFAWKSLAEANAKLDELLRRAHAAESEAAALRAEKVSLTERLKNARADLDNADARWRTEVGGALIAGSLKVLDDLADARAALEAANKRIEELEVNLAAACAMLGVQSVRQEFVDVESTKSGTDGGEA